MRERDAIEAIWDELYKLKTVMHPADYGLNYGWIEEVLTLTESRIQEDLEAMSRDMSL